MVDIRKPLNTFTQFRAVGQIAYMGAASPDLTTLQLQGASTAHLVPGMPVKLVAGAGSVPLSDLAVLADAVFGLVVFNPKVSQWTAYDYFQVLTAGEIALEASESLSRGDRVGLVYAGGDYRICSAAVGNDIGILLDDAVEGDIVDVKLQLPKGTYDISA